MTIYALNPNAVIGLLEERPYLERELLAALGVSVTVARPVLTALRRAGAIKRTGVQNKWALASYVAPVGRKATVDRDALHHGILAAVSSGPLRLDALVAKLAGFSRTIVREEVDRMRQAGTLQHVGASRSARWGLPGTAIEPVRRAVNSQSPWRKAKQPSASSHLGDNGRPISPATIGEDRATIVTKPKDKSAGSWWVGLDRDALKAGIDARQAEMRGTKEFQQVAQRLLQ